MRLFFSSSTAGHLGVRLTYDEKELWLFANDTTDKLTVTAAAQMLNQELGAAIRLAREEEYEAGYKDGRSKSAKKSWWKSIL